MRTYIQNYSNLLTKLCLSSYLLTFRTLYITSYTSYHMDFFHAEMSHSVLIPFLNYSMLLCTIFVNENNTSNLKKSHMLATRQPVFKFRTSQQGLSQDVEAFDSKTTCSIKFNNYLLWSTNFFFVVVFIV